MKAVIGVVTVAVLAVSTVIYADAKPSSGHDEKFCAVAIDGDAFSTGTSGPCPDVERWAKEHGG